MNNNTFVHKYIKSLIGRDDICVDMTAGNGNDTLFLASLCRKVYAFDISKEAIENTRKRIVGYRNVVLINDSHANADSYVKEKARLIIFNLGYLPRSGEFVPTRADSTLAAFKKARDLAETGAYIVVTFYLRHRGGMEEYLCLKRYIEESALPVLERYRQDRPLSPITYIIRNAQS